MNDRTTERTKQAHPPALQLDLLPAGMRLAVAVSGGADSVALLRALAEQQSRLGLVVRVIHMHHGIRGEAADQDALFVEALATRLNLTFLRRDVDTPGVAREQAMGLEEAARELRYGWFAELVAGGECDAVATAHTRDDQAETVLHRLLRGAWTEGLGGIHPVIAPAPNAGSATYGPSKGHVLRPFLDATREQIVAWLGSLGQEWREDATNADLHYTRNRIRHQLLPELRTYNPQIANQLAQIAAIARDEEAYWQCEVARLLPGLLLPGRAVRGGGRASSTLPGERALAIEVARLRSFPPALVRRLLRAAARELGVSLNFPQTERLAALVGERPSNGPRREALTAELRAERTPRELRMVFSAISARAAADLRTAAVEFPVPGAGEGFGWHVRCARVDEGKASAGKALLRAAKPSDRVQLRYSRGASKRIKEVLERMGVSAADRAVWPVLEWQREIVWMRGVALEPTTIAASLIIDASELPSPP